MAQSGADISASALNHPGLIAHNLQPRKAQSTSVSLQTGKLVAAHMNSPVDFNGLPVSSKDSVSRSYACHEAFVLCRRKHQGL